MIYNSDVVTTGSSTSYFSSRFFYWSNTTDAPLSVTVTPCLSSIKWSVTYRIVSDNTSGDFLGKSFRYSSEQKY